MPNATVADFLMAIKDKRSDTLDLEGIAAAASKLSDEEAVIAYHTLRDTYIKHADQFAPITDDVKETLGVLKAQALRGGTLSPFNCDSHFSQHMEKNPEVNILKVLGEFLADKFVFLEEPTYDALRAECAKYTMPQRLNVIANITHNPMTPMIMPPAILREVIDIISTE